MIVINDKDIKGEEYRSLIELAMKKCDKFAFVKRKAIHYLIGFHHIYQKI